MTSQECASSVVVHRRLEEALTVDSGEDDCSEPLLWTFSEAEGSAVSVQTPDQHHQDATATKMSAGVSGCAGLIKRKILL